MIAGLPRAAQWGLLILLTLVIGLPLRAAELPAGVLLGAIAAGIAVRLGGGAIEVPRPARHLSEAYIGTLVAGAVTAPALRQLAGHAPIFLTIGLMIVGASAVLSYVLLKLRLFPGTTAVWGLSPGAANVMLVLAGPFGADERLVAFMQYLRILMVAVTAPMVAHVFGEPRLGDPVGAMAGHDGWQMLLSVGLGIVGLGLSRILRFAGGTLLIPMALGAVAQVSGLIQIELPALLLNLCYMALGWSVGLSFTPAVLRHAVGTLPQTFLAMALLLGFCAGIGAALTHWGGIDPLTAYLATSPGGISSITVIAATSRVDLPFVASMQMLRFMLVLALGPLISRYLARHAV